MENTKDITTLQVKVNFLNTECDKENSFILTLNLN